MRKIAGAISSLPRNNRIFISWKGAKNIFRSLFFFSAFVFPSAFTLIAIAFWGAGCAIFQTRPVQEMSDTYVALRAAREVQADSLAPELYRQSSEWYFKARQEYRLKNFKFAKEYADKARSLAEQAEFEAIRNGGNRESQAAPDPLENAPPAKETAQIPAPEGTPAEEYEQRKAADDERRRKEQSPRPPMLEPTKPPDPYPPAIINYPGTGSGPAPKST